MELTRAAEDAAAADRHTTQSFEIFTNRAIYDNGWTAVSRLGLLEYGQSLWRFRGVALGAVQHRGRPV